MNELLQLPDVPITSNDNRINLYFPLIVSPGCSAGRWVLKVKRASRESSPHFHSLAFCGGREQSSPLHLLASQEIYGGSGGRYQESWYILEPHGRGGAQSCSLKLQRGVLLLFSTKEMSQHCSSTPWAAKWGRDGAAPGETVTSGLQGSDPSQTIPASAHRQVVF